MSRCFKGQLQRQQWNPKTRVYRYVVKGTFEGDGVTELATSFKNAMKMLEGY